MSHMLGNAASEVTKHSSVNFFILTSAMVWWLALQVRGLRVQISSESHGILQLCSASTRAGSSVCPMRRLGLHSQISSAPGILLWGNCPYELTDTTDFYQSWEFRLSHGKAGIGWPCFMHFKDTSLRILPLFVDRHPRFLPELGPLFVQWEGWDCTAKFHLLHKYFFEDIAPMTWLTPQVLQFIVTANVVCFPVS